MDQQYYTTITLDDFKRLYPNLNLENVQVVSVAGGVSDDSQNSQQQVLLASDESLVLSEAPMQQLVTYQQPTQTTQAYIIQSTESDSGQQAAPVAQSPIYYSTEVPTERLIHHQQTQQPQHLNISHQVQQETSQQSLLLQKAMGTTPQATTSIIQQPISNQTTTHQHVIMQQTPHIVLQQQSPQQHQQQSTGQIVLRPMHTSGMNPPRYVYQQQQSRTVVYNAQPQTTMQANQQHHVQQQHHLQHQQVESPTNRVGMVQQQQSRQLIVTSQPQLQANLIYQTTHGTHIQQQHQQTMMQQTKRLSEANLSTAHRMVRATRVSSLITQTQTPKLTPFRTNGPRFQTPITTVASQTGSPQTPSTTLGSAENINPPKPTVTIKQTNRKTNPGRGRVTTSPRGARGASARAVGPTFAQQQKQNQAQVPSQQPSMQQQTTAQAQQTTPPTQHYTQIRTIQYPSNQGASNQTLTLPPQRQNVPPLVSSAVPQRTINAVVGNPSMGALKRLTTSSPQRVIATQTSKNQAGNVNAAPMQTAQQLAAKYTIPKIVSTTNPNDLEESIQAVVVTKANEQNTSTHSISSSDSSVPKTFQTTVTTYSTIESDDEKKSLKINNGRVISLTEFKRQQQKQQQSQNQQLNKQHQPAAQLLNKQAQANRATTMPVSRSSNATVQPASTALQKSVGQQAATTSDDVKKVIRSQSQNQHIIQPLSNNKLQNPSGDLQKSARMLVVLSNGEQRLITFTLPRESCTVQELLEQVGVPFTPKTSIQCVPNPGASIDYIVTVGITINESPTELATAAENTLQLSKQQQEASAQQATSAEQGTATPSVHTSTQNNATTTEKQSAETPKEIPAKIIPGFLAVCTQCGYTGCDFAKCERCKRVFTEEPKRVATAKVVVKTDDEKKKITPHAELLNRAAAKASLAIGAPTLTSIRGGKVLITTTSGRGRGRGVPRTKPAEIEPVILTLSSDDDGDDEKSNKSIKTPVAAPSPPVHKSPLPCEPPIPENVAQLASVEREDVAIVTNSTDQLYTSITCKIIRFGTYRYDPKEKVLISSKGIKIVAPSCKNPQDSVVLNIQMREIVKIVAHLSKALNILFIYTLPGCGMYIRESLEMKPKSLDTPYYNPTDRSEPYKRIVLQIETISEEAKSVIRSIFAKAMLEEVQCSEANELLVRSCLKDKYIKNDQGLGRSETENIRQILIYPPGKGGIPINTEDYMCLAIDQYLNDVIIDFFLKYLHTNVLSDEQKHKTHIFSSFFYNRLTTMTTRQRHHEKDVKLTASQKRHARVKSWTKNVNLFEKDFIIIPINEQSHWFLAIICFPRLQGPVTYDTHEPVVNQPTVKKKKPVVERKVSLQIGNTTITPLSKRELDSVCLADDSLSERDEAEGDESDLASDESDSEAQNGSSSNSVTPNAAEKGHRPIKQPLILIFDSLAGASRSRVVATLRDYLTCEYRAKIKEDSAHVFNKFNMPGHCVKVPQQNNFTDCGLYVLQYVEQFFKDSIKDYKLPIKQLVNWFETIVVTRKREEISNLLKGLIEKFNPDKLPLPEIAFPTLNGKLIEPELTDEQAEFEEEEMDDEGEEEDEEELDSLADGEVDGETSPLKRNGEKRTITLTPNASTITLKRPLDNELSRSQEPTVRKTARLNESN